MYHKLKKLKYENEKLYQDCQRMKSEPSEQFNKEVETLEHYCLNVTDILNKSRELTQFKSQL